MRRWVASLGETTRKIMFERMACAYVIMVHCGVPGMIELLRGRLRATGAVAQVEVQKRGVDTHAVGGQAGTIIGRIEERIGSLAALGADRDVMNKGPPVPNAAVQIRGAIGFRLE